MITIVIPTYNQGNFIKRTIDSVLAQTYQDWELIIISCSTDNTDSVVREYTDKRIKYKIVPFCNMGDKLNMGFCMANGEYVGWLASDDYYTPTFMDDSLGVLKDNDWVYVDFFYDNNNVRNNIQTFTSYAELLRNNYLGIFWLFKRDMWVKIGLFQHESGEDYDFALSAVEYGYKPYALKLPLAFCGVHKNRASNSLDFKVVRSQILNKRGIKC